jgi:hypothetical protein
MYLYLELHTCTGSPIWTEGRNKGVLKKCFGQLRGRLQRGINKTTVTITEVSEPFSSELSNQLFTSQLIYLDGGLQHAHSVHTVNKGTVHLTAICLDGGLQHAHSVHTVHKGTVHGALHTNFYLYILNLFL